VSTISPNPNVQNLCVTIVRFVDNRFPGWVACEFEDANAERHILIDKIPIFTTKSLDASGPYPQTGTAPCEVLAQWKDRQGRELVRITTSRPDGVESTTGLSEFIVNATQVSQSK
jgi:hypothetical protein